MSLSILHARHQHVPVALHIHEIRGQRKRVQGAGGPRPVPVRRLRLRLPSQHRTVRLLQRRARNDHPRPPLLVMHRLPRPTLNHTPLIRTQPLPHLGFPRHLDPFPARTTMTMGLQLVQHARDRGPPDRVEPWQAVSIIQRFTARHLGDVGSGVEVVAVDKGEVEYIGEGSS